MTEVFENGYAVVVGVDDNNIRRLKLPTVAKDVQAVHDVLVHPKRCAYKADNVKLLKGAESTNKNILDALYWLQEKVEADKDATAVIYYSGHGMVDKKTDKYYLIPYDIRELSRVRADAIRADVLTAEISSIDAQRMLVILDCCHSAGLGVKDVDLEAIDTNDKVKSASFPIDLPDTKDIPAYDAAPGAKAVSDLLEGEGRAILNSSTGEQSSYVRKDREMSVFTYHLIEALTGHAPHPDDASVVYVTDVMSWVTHEVKKSAKLEGVDQTPVMRTSGVFPIAQLIGGQGVAKGLGGTPPSPLAPLPTIQVGHAEGAVIGGNVDTGGGGFVGGNMHEGDVYHGKVDQSTTTTTTNMRDKIETGGGDYVVGEKKIVQGDEVHGDKFGGDKVMGDKVEGNKKVEKDNITVGNISGGQGIAIGRGAVAKVSIQHGMAGSEDPDKQALQKLIQDLENALSKVPEAHGESIEAVTQTTQALVTMAEAENPNKTLLQVSGEGLKLAAKNLAEIAPDVLKIATSIVGVITGIG